MTEREQITIPPDGRPLAEQPKWRRDFPIDWPQDHYVARRDFTKFMVLTSFAFVFGQFWIVVQNFLRERRGQLPLRQIATVHQLAVGQSLAFNYPAEHDTCLLVRTGEQSFVAFDQRCTHLSCAVVPEPEKKDSSVPVITARSIWKPAVRWPARRVARWHGSNSKLSTTRFMLRASNSARSET